MTDTWQADRSKKELDESLLEMAKQREREIRGIPEPTPPEEPVYVPADPATERDAFQALLTAFADTDEGDTETTVDVLSLDEFTAETFTPVTPPEEHPS